MRPKVVPAPIVGRSLETAVLRDAVLAALAGRSRTIAVLGEAGIGKTRLLEEWLGEPSTARLCLLRGRVEEFESSRPFSGIISAFATPPPEIAARGAALVHSLKMLARPGDETDRPIGVHQLIDEVVDVVEELALATPAALIIEDLHWADEATTAALRALVRRVGHLPLVTVVSSRPHPRPPHVVSFLDAVTREGATLLELPPLDETEIVTIVRSIVNADIGPSLQRTLTATAGNPLYAIELAHGFLEDDAIVLEEGVADTQLSEIPPTLRLTILRRLSFLPPSTLEVLRLAAVLGTSFQVDHVKMLSGQTLPRIVEALEPAISAKVLEERGDALGFRHDLIHEAIYRDLPSSIRSSQHLDAARMLRSQGVSSARVAEHLLRAGEAAAPEAEGLISELAREVRLSTPTIAISLYRHGIELLPAGNPVRDELQVELIRPLVIVGHGEQAEKLAQQMLAARHDPGVEAEIRLASADVKVRDGRFFEAIPELQAVAADERYPAASRRMARSALAGTFVRTGNATAAAAVAEPLVAEARAVGDISALAGGLMTLGATIGAEGRVREALILYEEVRAIDERHRTHIQTPHLGVIYANMELDEFDASRRYLQIGRERETEVGEASLSVMANIEAGVHFFGGDWDDALAEATAARALIREGGSPLFMAAGYSSAAQICLRRGDLAGARTWVDETQQILSRSPQVGMDFFGWAMALVAEVTGDHDSFDIMQFGWDIMEPVGHLLAWRPVAPELVRMALTRGDTDRAAAVTSFAEGRARLISGVPSAEAAALRCRGLLEDDPETLVAAVEKFRESPRLFERARAAEDAAEALSRRGSAPHARALFEEALLFCEGVGAVRDVARITSTMRAAGLRRGSKERRQRPSFGWESLTATERRVAALTVDGMTNRSIAERLFVSKYTVQTHLSHIFAKLGISSRVELAAVAAKAEP